MSDEKSTGIAGSQKKTQDGASTTRINRKKFWRKAGVFVAIFLALLPWLNLYQEWRVASEEEEARQKAAAEAAAPKQAYPSAKIAPSLHRGTVTWDVYGKDGTVLPNVWSNEALGRPGCRMDVSYHDSFKAQTRYHSQKWDDYVPGTSPNVTAWRFMATEPGLTPPVYMHKC